MIEEYGFTIEEEEGPETGVIPFRILVLAELLPALTFDDYITGSAIEINRSTFNSVLRAQNIKIRLQIEDSDFAGRLLKECQKECFEIAISTINDFEPQNIIQNEEALSLIYNLLLKLSNASKDIRSISFTDQEAGVLGIEVPISDLSDIEFFTAELRFELNKILNQIIHHPRVQVVESAWRSLWWLVEQADKAQHCSISVLPINKSILNLDLVEEQGFMDSHFYDLVYTREYGQFGGKPFALILSDFSFDKSLADIKLIEAMGELCGHAHTLFVTAPSPSFFNCDRYSDISQLMSIEELLTSVSYIKWRSFLEKACSANVMMAFPRLLCRKQYDSRSDVMLRDYFSEDVSSSERLCLWTSAAYAFAITCMRSFDNYQLCTNLVGKSIPMSGLDNGLSINNIGSVSPLEVTYSELKEAELVKLGFTPLSANKSEQTIQFFSANSVRWGFCSLNNDQFINTLMEAQFNYHFIVLRLAHYLKVISRGYIGGTESRADLEASLNRWLRKYVSEIEHPSLEIRLKRPLRRVSLILTGDDTLDGFCSAKLIVTPHEQYLGEYFDLKLNFTAIDEQKQNEGAKV